LSDLENAEIADTPRKLTKKGLASCAADILPVGSVLFSSRAPIGHVALNTVPMATNQGFKSFIPKAELLDARFLYHWLRRNRPYLESLGNGATFKEVSKAVVSRIEISLPPLPKQRRIAEVLDRAATLRAKRRAALAQLDTLTQSIFLDMFGDPATNPRRWPLRRIAKNHAHADFIALRFNANYPHYKGEFARVITFKTEYAQSLIDNFSAKDKAPHVAISVEMLDTGIYVP
jgi:type I restriction enzyme S subunit